MLVQLTDKEFVAGIERTDRLTMSVTLIQVNSQTPVAAMPLFFDSVDSGDRAISDMRFLSSMAADLYDRYKICSPNCTKLSSMHFCELDPPEYSC